MDVVVVVVASAFETRREWGERVASLGLLRASSTPALSGCCSLGGLGRCLCRGTALLRGPSTAALRLWFIVFLLGWGGLAFLAGCRGIDLLRASASPLLRGLGGLFLALNLGFVVRHGVSVYRFGWKTKEKN